jgi:ComF family protein
LKYRRDIGFGEALTPPLFEFATSLQWRIDSVVPVPLGRDRQNERGYNQSALIARPLSMAMGLAYEPGALSRSRPTKSQVGLTRAARYENVRDAFRADGRKISGRTILLVDDVATTGATLSSCAEALLASGATDVFAITVARANHARGAGDA